MFVPILRKIILFIWPILFTFCCEAQETDLVKTIERSVFKESNYAYQGEVFKFSELMKKFDDYPEFAKQSNKAVRSSITSTVLGVTSLGIGIFGLQASINCTDGECLILSITIIPTMMLTGILGITLKIRSLCKEKRSIKVLNKDLLSNEMNDGANINLKLAPNGLSLVMNF